MVKGSQPAILAGDRARDNARCSTDSQDRTAQQEALIGLGNPPDRVSVDHGLTGTNAPGPVCARPWSPAAPATRWWWPSWTVSELDEIRHGW